MGASKSSPIFIGQGPLPEFDYSQQPLPDDIRVLLWLLDGAERRHRLARSWRAIDDLHVEVQGGEVKVTLPGTKYAATYCKEPNSRRLMARISRRKLINGLQFRKRPSSGKPGRSPTLRRGSLGGLHKARSTAAALGRAWALPGCYNLVEQCEHGSMASYIIQFDECGSAVQRLRGSDCKIMGR